MVPFDSGVTGVYRRLRANLEGQGMPTGPLDQQIAASALAHQLTLIARSTREFQRNAGLQLEGWTRP